LKNGYSRAAVADIAREADVSTATLYKHFSSKEELFITVVRETCSDHGSEFMDMGDGASAREIFHKAARDYLTSQFENNANALLRIVIAEVPTTPQVALETYDIIVERRRIQLIRAFDLMVERKLLKPHDTALGVDMIAGMIKESFVWPALFDANAQLPDNADAIIYEAIDIYLDRYAA
jgi:TetR/AcrR family transcriptional regulator of autoinduction and epiphytic fitness